MQAPHAEHPRVLCMSRCRLLAELVGAYWVNAVRLHLIMQCKSKATEGRLGWSLLAVQLIMNLSSGPDQNRPAGSDDSYKGAVCHSIRVGASGPHTPH